MSPERPGEKPLTLRDEVHGDITFDRFLRRVIDHECFQRLRYIKQLGLAEYVFPCATHTRFQHSLGAAYLAGECFETLLQTWQNSPFEFEGTVGKTTFYSRRTLTAVQTVAGHPGSKLFWSRVAILAGMLHDVGHGPWSHSFETLDLKQDFSAVTGSLSGGVGAYFETLLSGGGQLRHEEISVLYIHHILSDLAREGLLEHMPAYFLAIVLLVNRKMASGSFQFPLEEELKKALSAAGVSGGVDFHHLLRPVISGPFDVDRIDYIQRDARNCGVYIGGIEWRRLVNKLIPCLADHQNDRGEPREVVLVSSVKNHHVLDDFIFSLFQMYAQVYMHPKIVGIEESIRSLLSQKREGGSLEVTFEAHRKLSDEKFRMLLTEQLGYGEVDDLLARREGGTFRVASYPANYPDRAAFEKELTKHGFSTIDTQDRPMMKDSLGVFLYTTFKDGDSSSEDCLVQSWLSVSPIAAQFHSIRLSPNVWIRKDTTI